MGAPGSRRQQLPRIKSAIIRFLRAFFCLFNCSEPVLPVQRTGTQRLMLGVAILANCSYGRRPLKLFIITVCGGFCRRWLARSLGRSVKATE